MTAVPTVRIESLPSFVLIDDEPDDIFFLRRRLFQAGLRNPVATFENASHGYSFLRSIAEHAQAPEWVFIDVTMPGYPGLQLLRDLRRIPAFSGTRVAMFSNIVRPAEVDEAATHGANAFLLKFPTPDLLKATVCGQVKNVGLPGGQVANVSASMI